VSELNIGIIGGGIGGMTTAVALRQFGYNVTVYERAHALNEAGAGMMLWANAMRVFLELGLVEKIRPFGGEMNSFVVRGSNGKTLMDIATGDFDVPSVCIRRADLLSILVAEVPHQHIKLNHKLANITQINDKVVVGFENGVTKEHDAVIGADGIGSIVRKQIFDDCEPVYRGYKIWRGIATYFGDDAADGVSSETWGVGQRFGILNTGEGRFTWYATANSKRNHIDSPNGRKAELLELFAGWHNPINHLISNTNDDAIMKNSASDLPQLKRWVKGRIALLGDAAHPITPNLGQGGGMAIEDALVLAKSLRHEKSVENALKLYEKKRITRTKHIQQRSRLMGKIGQWQNPLIVSGREIVTNLLPAKIFEFNLRRVYSYKT
jgi:2-polyprenyl-6-methoxyphenol hydroxylase-like FAD-dependent oxidoreductase